MNWRADENLVVNNKANRVFMSWNYRPNSCPLEKLAYLLWKLGFSSSKHLFYYHQISAWQLSWLLLLAGSSSTETLLFK